MSRRLRLIAVCVGLLANAGCSKEHRLPTPPTSPSPAGPAEPAPPLPPSDPQSLAALALFDAVIVHEGVTTSQLTYNTSRDGKVVWTDGPCAAGSGSLQGSLDGGVAPVSETFLPTGSHTYVVSFSNCLVHYLAGIELNGVASAAYRAADWSNVTATVSADSVRGQGLNYLSQLYDVTADGSAVWTGVGSNWSTITYTPAIGSRLVNNSTGNVATFGGGSYSVVQDPGHTQVRFDNLKIAINGTEYALNGSLDRTSEMRGWTWTGETRIINNGTLAARIYGDVRNTLTVEVLVPLVPL